MNPLELTQAAAEQSGRDLAEMNSTYAELVAIAQTASDRSPIPAPPESIQSYENTSEKARELLTRANGYLDEATRIAESSPLTRLSMVEVLLAQAELRHQPEKIEESKGKADSILDQEAEVDAWLAITTAQPTEANSDYVKDLASYPAPGFKIKTLMKLYTILPDPEVITLAEAVLMTIDNQPGYSEALTAIAIATRDLDKMYEAAERCVEMEHYDSLAKLVAAMTEAGDEEKAMSIAYQYEDIDTKDYLLSNIIPVMAQKGDVATARFLIDYLEGTNYDLKARIGIAIVDPDVGIVKKVLAQAASVKEDKEQGEYYAQMILPALQAGLPAMPDLIIKNITDSHAKTKALIILARYYFQSAEALSINIPSQAGGTT